MGLMEMNRGFKRYAPWIMGALAIPFLGGAVLTGLGSALGGGDAPATAAAANPDAEKPVATVGGMTVTRAALDRRLEPLLRNAGGQVGPAQMDQYRYLLLTGPFPQSFKQAAALEAAAKAAGVTVSDADLAAAREKMWADQRPQIAQTLGLDVKATDAQIVQAIQKQQPGLSLEAIKASIPADEVRSSLYQQGLLAALRKQVKADEASVKRSYNDIRVRHILIKSGPGGLPDAQAKAKAEKILAEIKDSPAKMADLAKQHTDDPGSKATGGFYDWAPASRYVPEFTQAALNAGVGKVFAEPVKTQFGYHLIKLEGERPGKDFPKDWDASKQKYINEAVDREAQQKLAAAVTAQAATLTVDITDPGLRAAQLEEEAQAAPDTKQREAKLAQAVEELNKIAKSDDRGGAVPLRKAALLSQIGRDKDAIAAYEEALAFRNSVDTRVALAGLYLKQKNNAKALEQLDAAQKLLIVSPDVQARIGSLYAQAGNAAKGKTAMDKAAELRRREQQVQEAQMKAMLDEAKAKAAAASPPPGASPSPGASPAPAASPAAGTPSTAAAPSAAPAASPAPAGSPAAPAAR